MSLLNLESDRVGWIVEGWLLDSVPGLVDPAMGSERISSLVTSMLPNPIELELDGKLVAWLSVLIHLELVVTFTRCAQNFAVAGCLKLTLKHFYAIVEFVMLDVLTLVDWCDLMPPYIAS